MEKTELSTLDQDLKTASTISKSLRRGTDIKQGSDEMHIETSLLNGVKGVSTASRFPALCFLRFTHILLCPLPRRCNFPLTQAENST